METIEKEIVYDAQLTKVVNESGLQPIEAETIKTSYAPYFVQLTEIKEASTKINFENPTDIDEKIARDLRLKLVKVRTGSESIKDERKRIHLLKSNAEQAAWNLIKANCLVDEERFMQVEKKREIAEKARKEALKVERIEVLHPYKDFVSFDFIDLGAMNDEAFANLLNGAKLSLESKLAADKKAEEERLAAIEAEKKRQAEIEAENLKLKAEAEAKEKALAIEREKVAKEQKAAEEKAAKEKAEIEAKAKLEREAAEKKAAAERKAQEAKLAAEKQKADLLAAELKKKQDAELKAKAESEAKEKAEKLAAEKAAKAPKKQKLNSWIDNATMIAPTGLEKDATTLEIIEKFNAFKNWAKTKVETL